MKLLAALVIAIALSPAAENTGYDRAAALRGYGAAPSQRVERKMARSQNPTTVAILGGWVWRMGKEAAELCCRLESDARRF